MKWMCLFLRGWRWFKLVSTKALFSVLKILSLLIDLLKFSGLLSCTHIPWWRWWIRYLRIAKSGQLFNVLLESRWLPLKTRGQIAVIHVPVNCNFVWSVLFIAQTRKMTPRFPYELLVEAFYLCMQKYFGNNKFLHYYCNTNQFFVYLNRIYSYSEPLPLRTSYSWAYLRQFQTSCLLVFQFGC